MEEAGRVNGFGLNPGQRGSDWGHIALLDKTREFFQTCDVEGNGFITRTDMRVREGCSVSVCVFRGEGELRASLHNIRVQSCTVYQEQYIDKSTVD